MDETFIETRFRELKRLRAYPSARWLAESMQINRYSINKILSGDIQSERDRILFRAVLSRIGLTEESFFAQTSTSEPLSVRQQHCPHRVPYYCELPRKPVGLGGVFLDPDDWIEPAPGLWQQKVFAIRVPGTSLAPRLLPQDLIYLEPLDLKLHSLAESSSPPVFSFQCERLEGRIVAAVVNGEATLKVLRAIGGAESAAGTFQLASLNHAYRPLPIHEQREVRLVGVVVKTVREETLPIVAFA
jgi:phage repressor protein C with HTH and peptisase S24 domain